jgi:glutamate N-acetyltransferase/amino-acid N-acetyltransferase
LIPGGLGVVRGLRSAGVSAGFRRDPARLDLALVVVPEGSTAAAVFTRNRFCAAPVSVSREHLAALRERDLGARAVVLNSGNANAATGAAGRATAEATAERAAALLGCSAEQVLVASTGVIGVPLPVEPFACGLPAAIAALSDGSGKDPEAALPAAQAILTTDTVPKQAAARFSLAQDDGTTQLYHVGGICKGSGMIAPDMATMLAVLATDASIGAEALDAALREAVRTSFNRVTVDSDSSTNDSVFLLATGASSTAEDRVLEKDAADWPLFVEALRLVCEDLARQIARDGEGASKLVTVRVSGAASDDDAQAAARAVADSPLVKTAIAGRDANWGRVAMALGKSGAVFSPEAVSIQIAGLEVFASGSPVAFSEEEALRRLVGYDEIVIAAQLGAGSAAATVWTCDLTHDYININADYRS